MNPEVILPRYLQAVIEYPDIFSWFNGIWDNEVYILFIKISIGKNIGIISMINYMYQCTITCIISTWGVTEDKSQCQFTQQCKLYSRV